MTERASSKTALGVAALRAAHQLMDGDPKILDDPIIPRLLEAELLERIRTGLDSLQAPWALRLRAHVLLRSRYAEDRLAVAVENGMRQYVLLGAGLDTFAYRQPPWARNLRIFEVDHPASQQAKRARLAAAGIAIPPNVEFVAIDFESVSLRAGLLASSLELGQPAFFSCLGVLVYLTEEAVDALFGLVATLPEPSELIFTFSPPTSSLQAMEAGSRTALAAMVEKLGEPWRTHLDPETLAGKLKGLGFERLELLSPEESEERYFRGRSDSLRAPKHARIARAVVGKHSRHNHSVEVAG